MKAPLPGLWGPSSTHIRLAQAGWAGGSGRRLVPDRMNVPIGPSGASERDVRGIGAARDTSVAAVRSR